MNSEQTKYARRLWKQCMEALHSGLEMKAFDKKGTTVERTYCTVTGKLATTGCPSTATGVYKADNIPGHCTAHGGSAIDPDPHTPSTTTTTTTTTTTATTTTVPRQDPLPPPRNRKRPPPRPSPPPSPRQRQQKRIQTIWTGERKTATNRAQWFSAPITEEIDRVIGAFFRREPGGFLQMIPPADKRSTWLWEADFSCPPGKKER